ncbi:MAG: hypothetical protein QM775_13805 [Pirellulales bacterium]
MMNSLPDCPKERPQLQQPQQFRLATLLIGVTVVAALFGWIRTWEPATQWITAATLGTLAALTVPFLAVRRLVRSRFLRRRSYLATVVVSQSWLPTSLVAAAAPWSFVIGADRTGDDWTTMASEASVTVSYNMAIAILVAIVVDRLLRSRWSEQRRSLVCGGITTPTYVVFWICYLCAPGEWLLMPLVALVVAPFSFVLLLPIGMALADDAMCLRRRPRRHEETPV